MQQHYKSSDWFSVFFSVIPTSDRSVRILVQRVSCSQKNVNEVNSELGLEVVEGVVQYDHQRYFSTFCADL